MSGLSRKKMHIPAEWIDFCEAIIFAKNPADQVRKHQSFIENITASDVVALIDELINKEIPITELKKGINKLLNIFYKALNQADQPVIPKGSFLDYLILNNEEMEKGLKKLRPMIRMINRDEQHRDVRNSLLDGFKKLEPFNDHYVIKENVLFPLLEEKWPDYRCLKIMWSFHDDIRNNLKQIINILEKDEFELAKFNRLAGDLFFNMLAIKFREEKILFPIMMESISENELYQLLENSRDFTFPYIQPAFDEINPKENDKILAYNLNLETGNLSLEQIKLIFNHLPVDITYVDEKNKVRYFSTPKKRIFPRGKSIIGRDVKNCHPPESVHIVEEIVDEFRNGTRDKASFWINMGEEKILIQYFAIRDDKNQYRGVAEVSQEISEIQELKGEQRILDWTK